MVRKSDTTPAPAQARAIDLFCGCGGLTTGLKQAGFRVEAAVELDAVATETFRANHPDVKLWSCDISVLQTPTIMEDLGIETGDLDLLAGCPPCQGFSSMRTLNGAREIEDPRNDLIYQFLRLAEELLPKTLMLENVPKLRLDARFEKVTHRLTELGYTCSSAVLDASDYGVPQRRRRLILLAGRRGMVPLGRQTRRRRTVRNAIADIPAAGTSGDAIHDYQENRQPLTLRRIKAIPKNGGSRESLPEALQLKCHQDCDGFKDVYGRMSWDDVSPTLTTGCFNPSKGRFLHPEEDRAITMREAALLQTFPKDYRFPAERGKTTVARLIGNALPPEFIRRHALSVLSYLRRRKR